MLKIEIVSDPVCPWCYIGKRRLEQALEQRPDVQAEISWSPYQLSPDMPPEGRDRRAHYESIFGAERARMISETMADTARAEGLVFELKPGARSPNTLRAHLLLDYAASQPGIDCSQLADSLFAAHHVDCEDIGDIDVLLSLATAAGLDPEATRQALASPEREAAVKANIAAAAARGVTGVPFFIFNGRYAVSGAQPPEAFIDLFDRLSG